MAERPDPVACLLGGALGDALGGITERGDLSLSDDTQMTLATCEAILEARAVDSARIADVFRRWFLERRLTGLGSATLKALRDLSVGAHWALSGATGEMSAGNGGAMRIAPLAFVLDGTTDRRLVRDVVFITHKSDEAYLGALAVLLAIQMQWPGSCPELLSALGESLPDSRIRDRLLAVARSGQTDDLAALGRHFGCSGYVVDTVPLAIAAAWAMTSRGFEPVIGELDLTGGDTDTIASIAAQVAGARTGSALLPPSLLASLPAREWVEDVARRFDEFVAAGRAPGARGPDGTPGAAPKLRQ